MDNYDKISVIGRGAFGVVYLCQRLENGRRVAVKLIPLDGISDDELQAVMNEVNISLSLNNPHIIRYHTSFVENNSLAIVMDYARRGTLDQYIEQRKGVILSENAVLDMFAQLCIALGYLHKKNILHRDLTANNVLLTGFGRNVVKLSDFGISVKLKTCSKASSLVGTPLYLSPELCQGKAYRTGCDLWSLGCLLYLLLTLRLPFTGDNICAITNKIINQPVDFSYINRAVYSDNLIDIVNSLLSKDPIERPSVETIVQHPAVLPVVYQIGVDLRYIDISRDPTLTSFLEGEQ